MTIGIVIGLIVLLLSIGFVALMMVNEWTESPAEVLAKAAPGGTPASKVKASRKAPKKKAKAKK